MKIIAHRGASGEFQENSLLAFEKAIEQNADSIELDARYHSSGEFILLHDRYLDNTSEGKGDIESYSLCELLYIKTSQAQTITTLSKALQQIHGRCPVNIELKDATDNEDILDQICHQLLNIIKQACANDNFLLSDFAISAFNHKLLARLNSLYPDVETAALIACSPMDISSIIQKLTVRSVNMDINCINQKMVDDAHREQKKVNVYTVDYAKDIELCHKLKVDGIFTNFPQKTRDYINKNL